MGIFERLKAEYQAAKRTSDMVDLYINTKRNCGQTKELLMLIPAYCPDDRKLGSDIEELVCQIDLVNIRIGQTLELIRTGRYELIETYSTYILAEQQKSSRMQYELFSYLSEKYGIKFPATRIKENKNHGCTN